MSQQLMHFPNSCTRSFLPACQLLVRWLGNHGMFVNLLQVRRSPQRLQAVHPTLQNAPDESLAAQRAADKAAAELIAEEQVAAIRQQQACMRAAHTKAKKQEPRHNSQKGSQGHHTIHNKDASSSPAAYADSLVPIHAINIDAVVYGLAHDTSLQQQAQGNGITCMQSLDLHPSQDSPQTYVSALRLDALHHIGNDSSRLARDRQAGCLDSPDLRHADDDQLMQKMLCCPLTKVRCKLHCSPSSLVSRRPDVTAKLQTLFL